METIEVKDFYNTTLRASANPYEYDRWFKSPQMRAGYENTKDALYSFVPHLLRNDMKVFELGPGPGTWTKELLTIAPAASYDLIDISEEMLKQAQAALGERENISYTVSDILQFVPQTTYDFFFSSRIIEYVPDKESAINIIARSLKPGAHGYLVTKTPQYHRPFGKKVSREVHLTQIHPVDLVKLLKQHGLEVIEIIHVTCVFPSMRSGFLDRVLTRVCRYIPFNWSLFVSESYAVVFRKK